MMKRIISQSLFCAAISLLSYNTYAANPGLYLDVGAGWGYINQRQIPQSSMSDFIAEALGDEDFTYTSFNNHTRRDGVAGRIAIGWQFGCIAGAELGWSKFADMTTNANALIIDTDTGFPAAVSTVGTLRTDAFDLVAKGIVPFPYGISIFGKLGVAYLEGRRVTETRVEEGGFTLISHDKDLQKRWWPTFGVGAAVDYNHAIQFQVAWSRIQKVDDIKLFGSTDLVTAGFCFHFDV